MKKPYIMCHMMASIDGRIDCAMTAKLEGVQEYYDALKALEAPTTVSGRVTGQLELALPGEFTAGNPAKLGQEAFWKSRQASGYSVVADSRGRLLWESGELEGAPLLILTTQDVTKEYLAYLEEKDISWIACGQGKIDLARACHILVEHFAVERMAVVGGGRINGAFLDAGLLDEVSLVLAPGIDGRGSMTALFDGLPQDREPVKLKLQSALTYENGALWLRYKPR